MNYDIEINGEWYISVKGTANAYEVGTGIISYHIRKNSNIFKKHVFSQEVLLKKLKGLLTPKEKTTLNKQWLDKFAFYKIGTLLNSSPITDPIKEWQTQIEEREVEGKSSLVLLSTSIQTLQNQIQSLEDTNIESTNKTNKSIHELKETVEIIGYDQKRNDKVLVAYGRGNILFIKQDIGIIYSELSEYSIAYNKWAYDNKYEKGTYKLWWEIH